MSRQKPSDVYRHARIESAPPLKLVQLMYEGALRFVAQAEAASTEGDATRFQERCLRAQAVISELRIALDRAHSPELVDQLEALYLFSEGQIRTAILEGSAAPLGPVRDTLTTLLDGWNRIEVGA